VAGIDPISQQLPLDINHEVVSSAEDQSRSGESVPTNEQPVPEASVEHNGAHYSVHVQTFRAKEKAQRAVAGYLKRGFPAFLSSSPPAQDGRRWRVLIGRFDTPEEAGRFGEWLGHQDGFTQVKVIRLAGAGP
jgi:cell division septation protein DedD